MHDDKLQIVTTNRENTCQLAMESSIFSCTQKENATGVEAWALVSSMENCVDQILCSAAELDSFLNTKKSEREEERTCAVVAKNDYKQNYDHIYPSASAHTKNTTTILVYGMLGTPVFHKMHELLLPQAIEGNIRYIFRHNPVQCTESTLLQGYGVALDIKNMEYKTIDDSSSDELFEEEDKGLGASDEDNLVDVEGFLFSRLFQRYPELKPELKDVRSSLIDQQRKTTSAGDGLKAWELKDLGLTAVHEIINAKDPFKRLQQISQDFPKYAKRLISSSKKVSQTLRNEIEANQEVIASKQGSNGNFVNTFYFNGIKILGNDDKFNAFNLLRILRKEFAAISQFEHLPSKYQAKQLMLQKLAIELKVDDSSSAPEIRLDFGSVKNQHVPLYLNNIETDEFSQNWPTSVDQLLQQSYNLVMLRKNMYEIIVIVDPVSNIGIQTMQHISMLHSRGAPIRFGFVFTNHELLENINDNLDINDIGLLHHITASDDLSKQAANAWHVAKVMANLVMKGVSASHDNSKMEQFLQIFLQTSDVEAEGISIEYLIEMYLFAIGSRKDAEARQDMIDILSSSKLDEVAYGMSARVKDKGVHLDCHLFNGKYINGLDLQSKLMHHLGTDQHLYGELVRQGVIQDTTKDLIGHLLKHEKAFDGLIPDMMAKMKSQDGEAEKVDEYQVIPTDKDPIFSAIPYFHYSDSRLVRKQQTLIAFVNFDIISGVRSAKHLLEFILTTKKVRIAILVTRSDTSDCVFGNEFMKLVSSLGPVIDDKALIQTCIESLDLVIEWLSKTERASDDDKVFKNQLSEIWTARHAQKWEHVQATNVQTARAQFQSFASLFKLVSSTSPITMYLNGRKVQLDGKRIFRPELLKILFQYDRQRRTTKIVKKLKLSKAKTLESIQEAHDQSNAIWKVCSVLGQYQSSTTERRKDTSDIDAELERRKSQITLSGNPAFQLRAYLDPVSESAQRMSTIFRVLHDRFNVTVNVVLCPRADYDVFPLTRFYRYIFGLEEEPAANFEKLPLAPILTVKIETPESWNVQVWHSIYDLDNLQVHDRVHDDQTAEYQLKSLSVAGQCLDTTSSYLPPPNGLQLQLLRGSRVGRVETRDTLVMQNLGYFQFQATPGQWTLELAPGRGRQVYQIVDAQGHIMTTVPILVNDFDTPHYDLFVRKQRGKENTILLDLEDVMMEDSPSTIEEENEEDSSTFSWIMQALSSVLYGTEEKAIGSTGSSEDETIHVFSLATGHLYERMLKIMMLSVTKRTSSRVQFWLLENFLSPAFKESIPILREQFGISIRLMTYKWPEWLRQQTEKQRIIWGYKILFLDVLFPLGLKKIIYVDADQVIRADLKELWDMDLQGHVCKCPSIDALISPLTYE